MELPSFSRREFVRNSTATLGLQHLFSGTTQNRSAITISETGSRVTVGNGIYDLSICKTNGGIIQLHSISHGLDLRSVDGQYPPTMWGIQFYHGETDSVRAPSQDADFVSLDTTKHDGQITVDLRWDQPTLFGAGSPQLISAAIQVQIVVDANDPVAKFSISIENDSDWAIKSVDFPLVSNIPPLGGGDGDAIILPNQLGRRIPDPIPFKDYSWRPPYPSGLLTMQFTAYTCNSGGFYLDARDTQGYAKSIGWTNQNSEAERLQLAHGFDIQKNPGDDVTIPYSVSMGPLDGDWHAAADRYRAWMEAEDWLPNTGTELPDWYRNLGATFHAKSYVRPESTIDSKDVSFNETIDRAIGVKERIQTPMQFSWWGYQTNGNFGYGDWFPPKEGWDSYRRSIHRLEDHGYSLLGFLSTKLLAQESDLWQNRHEEAKDWIIRDTDQSLRYVSGMGLKRYRPSFTADGWQETVQKALRTFVEEGARQVQLDGFPWSGPPECYAENHAHDPGKGGNWYAQESKGILENIRNDLYKIDDSVVISGEGIADFYLPYMDIQMGRDVVAEEKDLMVVQEGAEIIPLTQYTIGDHIAVRASNHTSLVDGKSWTHPKPYLRLSLGRALQWGALLLFRTSVDVPKRFESETLLEYVSNIAWAFHLDAQRFLVDGQLLRPPAIDEGDTIKTQAITTVGEGEFTDVTTPAILSSAWASQDGDDRAIILTNVDNTPQTTTISATDHPFSSTESPLFYSVSNGEYRKLAEVPARTTTIEVTLEPREVRIIVATPYTDQKETALDSIIEAQHRLDDPVGTRDAVRLFLEGKYNAATSTSNAVSVDTTEEPPTPTTETPEPTETTGSRTATQSDSSRETKQTSTPTETPGFGLISAVTGFISAAIYAITRERNQDD